MQSMHLEYLVLLAATSMIIDINLDICTGCIEASNLKLEIQASMPVWKPTS